MDPDQEKRFTSAPVSLHPSTPWLEIACAHAQSKSPPLPSHCPGEKEHRLCPALFKHIASSRFPPCVSRFHANPSRKSNIRVYQLGFHTRWKESHRFFITLRGTKSQTPVSHWRKGTPRIPPEKEARGVLFLHPTADGTRNTCCHKKAAATHTSRGRTDRSPHLEVI